ncbi:MAG: NAD(P)-dependent oxidoreductase [Spirochaetales bacterium]|nr:NAD(P)-dependent oxidoreductase [Spirochaetales bacterium]
MKILITGAFGNIGMSVLEEAIKRGHKVSVFEMKTKKTMRLKKKYLEKTEEIILSDLRNRDSVKKAIAGKDVVIHLASIIPPLSETDRNLCFTINVDCTRSIVDAIKETGNRTMLIFTSSCSVMGPDPGRVPPVKIDDPVHPVDNYTKSKVKAEEYIRQSTLNLYCITRLGAVMPTKSKYNMKMIIYGFEFPYHSRIEMILDRDVATALLNASESLIPGHPANKNVFFLGGGENCRLYYGDFFNSLLSSIGIAKAGKEFFNENKPSFLDWMDTKKAQEVLLFQNHTFKDYLTLFKSQMKWVLPFTKLFGKIIGKLLIKYLYYRRSNFTNKFYKPQIQTNVR